MKAIKRYSPIVLLAKFKIFNLSGSQYTVIVRSARVPFSCAFFIADAPLLCHKQASPSAWIAGNVYCVSVRGSSKVKQ